MSGSTKAGRVLAVLFAMLSFISMGCSGSGEDSDSGGGSSTLDITSSQADDGFNAGSSMPTDTACTDLGGSDKLPNLSFSGIPSGAMSLAVVMEDETVPTTHMVLFNIPATTTEIDDEGDFSASNFATSDLGERGYSGPCPPDGDEAHTYRFTLYALSVDDLTTEVSDPTNADQVIAAIQANDLASDSITGTFAAP